MNVRPGCRGGQRGAAGQCRRLCVAALTLALVACGGQQEARVRTVDYRAILTPAKPVLLAISGALRFSSPEPGDVVRAVPC